MPDDQRFAPETLYERDFYAWTSAQKEALSALCGVAGVDAFAALDLEHLAEEIEGLGKAHRRELARRVTTAMEHLLKLEFSTLPEPRRGWEINIRRSRSEIADLLEESPSLRRQLPAILQEVGEHAIDRARMALELYDLSAVDALSRHSAAHYGEAELLGDWIPGPPAA